MARRQPSILPSKRIFFLEGVLYRKIKTLPADNLIIVENLQTNERTAFVWTVVRHKIEKAWQTANVAALMGRSSASVRAAVANGRIKISGIIYNKEIPTLPDRYYWSKDDILNLHEYFRKFSSEQKTKDGTWRKAKGIPSRVELLQMMDTGVVSYIRTKDGEYIPAFMSPDH